MGYIYIYMCIVYIRIYVGYTLIGLRFDDSMVSELILECHKYLGKYGNIW